MTGQCICCPSGHHVEKRPLSTPVNDYLHADTRWKAASGEMKAAFRVSMRGRAYGLEPTLDAWAWFAAGWSARLSQP